MEQPVEFDFSGSVATPPTENPCGGTDARERPVSPRDLGPPLERLGEIVRTILRRCCCDGGGKKRKSGY
jgi:hypothetical protein